MIRHGVRRAFDLLRGPRSARAQVDEEIALHLELRAAQLERRGYTPDAARREAERRFGSLAASRHALHHEALTRERAMRLRERWDSLRQDVRYAVRGLARQPGFALVVVLTLALGIGANAAMFGVLDRLLLSGPTSIHEADRLRRLYTTSTRGDVEATTSATFAYVTLGTIREHGRTMAQLAAYTPVRDVTLGRGIDAERVRVRYATASLFPLLGARPALGRLLVASDERAPAGEPVAVLDHGAWRRRFGGDSAVLGRTVVLDDRRFTVVGVAPPGFTGPELEPVELWLPVSASVDVADWPTTQRMRWLRIVGRLAPGATLEQAAAEATQLHLAEPRDHEVKRPPALSWRPLWYDQHGVEAPVVAVSRWLIGVSVALLLVACANVANLLLARGVRRRRELAVRLALGAARTRLARLLLVEGALLALAGGVAGVLVAWAGIRALRATLLAGLAWSGSALDARVLLCAGIVTVLTALLVALLPALRASDLRLSSVLASGSPQAGAARSPLRAGLTVVQGALSMVLLVGAGLFVHSLWNVRRLDVGVEPAGLLQVELRWPEARGLSAAADSAEWVRRVAVRDAALARLRTLPGVAHAAAASGMPFHAAYWAYPRVPGRDSIPSLPGGGPFVVAVTDDYFAAAGTRLVAGRGIAATDVAGAERVAVVNETMARTLWPAGDAIGRCFHVDERTPTCTRVVGIAEDTRIFELHDEAAMQFYLPQSQYPRGMGALAVRADGDVRLVAPQVRRALLDLDPSLTDASVRRLDEELAPQLRPWRLGASLFALFGALALVVAGIGLYSVMVYAAASRTREIGVRLALGARPADVRRLLLRQGVGLGAAGMLLGLLLALAAGRWVAPLLFGTSPREPVVLAGVLVALSLVVLLAALVPARRAARTAPAVVLRSE